MRILQNMGEDLPFLCYRIGWGGSWGSGILAGYQILDDRKASPSMPFLPV